MCSALLDLLQKTDFFQHKILCMKLIFSSNNTNSAEYHYENSDVIEVYYWTAWLRQNWNGVLLLTSKRSLILSIYLWWVKLISSPVSYEPAFGLWKAVFSEIQKSNFITVRFLTFEIGLYLGPNHQKMMRIIPRNILRTLNQKFIQYSAHYSTFCGFGLLSFLIFLEVPSSIPGSAYYKKFLSFLFSWYFLIILKFCL